MQITSLRAKHAGEAIYHSLFDILLWLHTSLESFRNNFPGVQGLHEHGTRELTSPTMLEMTHARGGHGFAHPGKSCAFIDLSSKSACKWP